MRRPFLKRSTHVYRKTVPLSTLNPAAALTAVLRLIGPIGYSSILTTVRMRNNYIFAFFLGLGISLNLSAEPLKLNARRQTESEKGSGKSQKEEKALEWEGKKTALIICDMWNEHWCKGATERVGEMAPRMNEVVKAARAKGVSIIHAPSDTMKFYEGTVQRKRAQNALK